MSDIFVMTSEQTLKNIAILKNLVWPIDSEFEIHFNFTSEFEFNITYDKDKSESIISCLENTTIIKEQPIAFFSHNQYGHLVFSYHDSNLYYYEKNYNTGKEYYLYWDEIRRKGLRSLRQKILIIQMIQRLKSIVWN